MEKYISEYSKAVSDGKDSASRAQKQIYLTFARWYAEYFDFAQQPRSRSTQLILSKFTNKRMGFMVYSFRRLHRQLIKCHRCAIFRSTLIALYQAIAQFAERLRHKNISAYLLISCFFFISLYPDKSGIRQLQKVKLEHNENN